MTKPLLVLFDGNALIHRAFHAMPPLTVSKTGEMVGAVYGFTSMMVKVINEQKPTHYAVAFDKAAPTFRHVMFDQYKIHRPETPDELVNQFGRVRQLVDAFNIPIYELDGYEADDVLGTLCKQASEQGVDTVIVTGDADAMQLVTLNVKILYPKPKGSFSNTILYDEAAVTEKFGVKPSLVADYKALVGDPSDNIPGVKGVGEKTAVKLIQQFGSIEQIYEHVEEVTPPKLQALLKENGAQARQSKKLATIVVDAPVTLDLEKCRVSNYDRQKVTELFRELEFFSLLTKLPQSEQETQEAIEIKGKLPEGKYRIISSAQDLDELINNLSAAKSFAFDIESTSLDAMSAELVGISFSPASGQAYYIPVGHRRLDEIQQLPLEQVIEGIRKPLEDPNLPKTAHNGKYDSTVLAEHGINVKNLNFDTMIAAYLLGEKALNLKELTFGRLGIELTALTSLIGTGSKQIPVSGVDIKALADYCCADSDMAMRLAELFAPGLVQQGLWKLFAEVEMPLVPVLIHMERSGVALDTQLLHEMSRELAEQISALELKIWGIAKHQFNINSPQQLSKVLFEEMQIPGGRKSKGVYSTGADVLEELRGQYEIINLILEYRQITKLKSTYIDALPELINPKTGRIHTDFNQTRTTTGRLSSSDPNLQNIPVRGELGRKVRKAFIAPTGTMLLAGDYSQIDLRVLAHLSQDERLVDAFKRNEDIHAATAAQLFNVPTSNVTPDMRRVAKTVNFGVIYGMSEYGLEQATELSRQDANRFIAAYFEKYPGVRSYLDLTKQHARDTGYVQTLMGRRRAIPEINSSNRIIREAAERMAINMPVQGTSADIIKVAMVNLYGEMQKRQLKSKMLLQVHDELVFEVPEAELPEMQQLVPKIMSTAVDLSVPAKVDMKTGKNWGEME